jgi:hypothetical protein
VELVSHYRNVNPGRVGNPREIRLGKLRKIKMGEVLSYFSGEVMVLRWKDKKEVLIFFICHNGIATETTVFL